MLAVDDEERVCRYYRDVLSPNGYQVQTAGSAEEALRRLERHTFDLILLDLKMPGMDGMAFLRILRQQGDTSKVLMVSGFATTEDAVEAARLGGAHVIEKPCDPEKLRAQVHRILDPHLKAVVEYIRAHFAEIGSREEVAHPFQCHTTPTADSDTLTDVDIEMNFWYDPDGEGGVSPDSLFWSTVDTPSSDPDRSGYTPKDVGDVITHEIGHLLGAGHYWGNPVDTLNTMYFTSGRRAIYRRTLEDDDKAFARWVHPSGSPESIACSGIPAMMMATGCPLASICIA